MQSPDGYPVYEHASKGTHNLLLNREAEKQEIGYYSGLTPPSRNPWYHGRVFGWDPQKHIIIWAREGSFESLAAAQTESYTLYAGQLASGQVPNQRHLYGGRTLEAKITGTKEHNFYGHPPLGAIAGIELYHAMEKHSPPAAKSFFESIYDNLDKEALYMPINRSNGPEDFRIGVIASEETGMDESPIFDHQLPFKRWLRNGEDTHPAINAANMAIHITGRYWLDRQRKGLKDNEEGLIKAKEIFWVMPVQIQALVTANLYALAKLAQKLGKENDSNVYAKFAENIENQVLNDIDDPMSPGMWDQAARDGKGMFRDLDRHGQPIVAEWRDGTITEETTGSNVMAILFPNIKEHQLSSVVDMAMEDFMEEFGMSTVGKKSPSYDPNHGEKESGRWRTPAWLDQAWLIAEPLLTHINREDLSSAVKVKCKRFLSQLCETSLRALGKWEKEGTPIPEYSSHLTGQALRLYRVRWFAWNNLGYVMPPDLKPSVFAEALLQRVRSDEDELEQLAA